MAMLTRWDPFGEIGRVQDELMRWGFGALSGGTRTFSPAVDIYEDDDAIRVEAELPGVRAEDVQVQVEDNVLTIRGERRQEREDKGEGYQRVERVHGLFSRSFSLPGGVLAEDIEAEMSDGVLHVRLPKKPAPEPRRISVRSSATGARQLVGGEGAAGQTGATSPQTSQSASSAQAQTSHSPSGAQAQTPQSASGSHTGSAKSTSSQVSGGPQGARTGR